MKPPGKNNISSRVGRLLPLWFFPRFFPLKKPSSQTGFFQFLPPKVEETERNLFLPFFLPNFQLKMVNLTRRFIIKTRAFNRCILPFSLGLNYETSNGNYVTIGLLTGGNPFPPKKEEGLRPVASDILRIDPTTLIRTLLIKLLLLY